MEQPMGMLLLSDYSKHIKRPSISREWMEQPMGMLLLSDYIQAYQETLNGAAIEYVIT